MVAQWKPRLLIWVIPVVLMTTSAKAAADTAPAANRVQVILKEWRIHFKNTEAKPGELRFVVHNSGKYVHAFDIDHNGKRVARSTNIQPGKSTTVAVRFKPGQYDVYCPIDGHKDLGMDCCAY